MKAWLYGGKRLRATGSRRLHALRGDSVINDTADLKVLESADKILDEATSLEDLQDIRDKAEAVRKYAKSAGLGLEIQNQAAEVKLRAERRAGLLLARLRLHGGNRRSQHSTVTLKLSDLGISRAQSHRWQAVAAIHDDSFRRYVHMTRESGKEITTAGLLRFSLDIVADESTNRAAGSLQFPPQLLKDGTKFGCVYIDPPWNENGKSTPTKDRERYVKSLLRQLVRIPIRRLTTDRAHVHLWTTSSRLSDAIALLRRWGLQYASCFVWLRPGMKFGQFWSETQEFLVLGVKGKLAFRNSGLPGIVDAEAIVSRTPDAVRQLIEQASPGPYLELFGESPRPGWTVVRRSD
jgi:N6-adenosine-specific RNA methylase IME4